MIQEKKEDLINRIAEGLKDEAHCDFDLARSAAKEGIKDVEKLLINHTEAI